MKNPNLLQSIITLILFFLVQSIIISLIAGVVWNFSLINLFGFQISFMQWVGMVFLFNLIRFDIFKFIISLSQNNIENKKKDDEIQ